MILTSETSPTWALLDTSKYIWLLPALLTLAAAAAFLIYVRPKIWTSEPLRPHLRGSASAVKINAKSLLPMILIIAAYSPVAFWQLGTTETPQSFAGFKNGPLSLTLNAQGPHNDVTLDLYSGLGTGTVTLYASEDGVNWDFVTEFEQDYVALFKWHSLQLTDFPEDAKYIRLTASDPNIEIGEAYMSDYLTRVRSANHSSPSRLELIASGSDSVYLTDEPGLDSGTKSWMNNSYFDEIYHPRTAYEHIRGVTPYEITHPPLGKIILGSGIRIFGMNPFGWRVAGTVLGIVMLIPLYLFVQNMFGNILVSTCATVLFASDFMHYVQTRIGTVDTEAVLFILLMYYFMYRYFTMPESAPLSKQIPWLILSGISFGLGAAVKWVTLYGAIGLLFIWIVKMVHIIRYRRQADSDERRLVSLRIIALFLVSVLSFIILPVTIYCLSYIPYAQAGYGASADGTLSGYLKMVWENQKYMLNYHGGLSDTHPYSSTWGEWLTDFRPILYFQWFEPDGIANIKSVFGAFTNPLTTWAGLGAIIFMVPLALKGDRKALLILAGWLSQLLPWVFIPRISFAYHYFPNVVFLMLALARLMIAVTESEESLSAPPMSMARVFPKSAVIGFTALSVLLFALFFPALSGKRMTRDYAHLLQWFNNYYPF